VGSAFGGWRFEALDQGEVDFLEPGVVVVGVVADEGEGLTVIFGGFPVVPTRLVDHGETIIAVVDAGESLQQFLGGLFGLIELAGLDHIDDGIGCHGQFEGEFVFVIAIGEGSGAWALRFAGGVGRALGSLILAEAAFLVFLSAAAGAGIIASGFGHVLTSA